MASFNSKFNLRTALQRESKPFSFIEDHTTTGNFMELLPLYKRLLIPRTKLNISAEVFCRLNAMHSVSYGRANFNCRAFFVPLRTAWFGWNEFISDTYKKGAAQLVSRVPSIPNSVLRDMISTQNDLSSFISLTTDPASVTVNYDFAIPSVISTGGYRLYRYSAKGKRYYKILRSLGYDILYPVFAPNPDSGSSVPFVLKEVNYNFNALPLLALARVAFDWYYPSQYSNSLVQVSKLFYETGSYNLTMSDVMALLDVIDVSYSPDYFTAAFDKPNSPNSGAGESSIIFETGDGYTDDGQRVNADNQTVQNFDNTLLGNQITDPHITLEPSAVSGRSKLSQFTLDTLMALSSYLKRNQLAGSRVIDRYLARYGIKLSSSQIERCIYLSGDTNPLQFGTVFSQSDSGDAIVGDYNGVGSFSQQSPTKFSCESGEDYGYFFILGSFVPQIGYVQGLDRDVLYSSKYDIFTPEFDALGTQAISASELFTTGNHFKLADWESIIQQVFGFTPRYSEYKVARDRVTGDISLNGNQAELSSYTMKRLFTQDSFGSTPSVASIKHSLDFVKAVDKKQFARVFYTTNKVEDHLRLVCMFRSEMYAPMKHLYEVYDWDKHNESGNDITIDSNGAKLD